MGAKVLRAHPELALAVVEGMDDAGAAALRSDPSVAFVAPDYEMNWIPEAERIPGQRLQIAAGQVTPASDQSDAFFFDTYQWNMRIIEADDAWLATNQGAGALVCVLDTGVDPGQQDLVGKVDLTKSFSLVVSEPFIEDLNFHGTHVSGTVSSNGIGTASVAPDATLCAIKVLGASGSGTFSDVISGIIIAGLVGADVINMSLGAYIDRTLPGVSDLIAALTDAVAIARSLDAQVVAASGNNGAHLDEDGDMIVLPAQIAGVLAVTATGPVNQMNFDQLAPYANVGGRRPNGVNIAAPGGNPSASPLELRDWILAPCSRFVCGADGFYIFAFGTSMAAPHVSGAGAVVESQFAGNQNARFLDRCILNNADVILNPKTGRPDKKYGRGRLNVYNAALSCVD
jgi:subtilisin family serine protease